MKSISIQKIQQLHGTVLIILALGLAFYSAVAEKTGWGPYGFLHEIPWGEVGLIQAYLLMAIIGFCIRTASKSRDINKVWNIVGLLAHIPPLMAVVLYGYLFQEIGIGYILLMSVAIHGTWITLELLTLVFLKTPELLEYQVS